MQTKPSSRHWRCDAQTPGDVDCLASGKNVHIALEGHFGRAGGDEPVFGATSVSLVAEAPPRAHLDALHLVSWGILQDFVVPPRSIVPFAGHQPTTACMPCERRAGTKPALPV